MDVSNIKEKPKMARYPLASAGRRLGAKILDIILISLIVFGLGFAILCTSPGFDKSKLETIEPWRYAVLACTTFVLFVLYFIIIPRFWKKTLFMKAFKLQYVNNLPLKKFGVGLIQHEILIWGIIVLISLIVGIILGLSNVTNAVSLIHGISFKSNNITSNDNPVFFYLGIGFATFYIVAFLVMVSVIISLFVKNRKPAYHDKFSNIFVIHLVQINEPDKQHNIKKNNQRKINYGVPGDISSGAFEEIDNL